MAAPLSYESAVVRGDVVGAFRMAIVTASLWSIGSAWSVAVRQVVLELVPDDGNVHVAAEIGAALMVTVAGAGAAILATRDCAAWCKRRGSSATTPTRVQSMATRRPHIARTIRAREARA